MIERLRLRLHRLLRWSERYTKTDMVYLASGGFWTTSVQAVFVLASIPLSIAFANLFTPQEYGIYRYVLTMFTVIGAFSLTGLGTALTRAVARGFEGSLARAFSVGLRWSTPLVLIALVTGGYYGLQQNYELAIAMIFIAVFSPLINNGGLFSAYLNGKQDFKRNALYANWRTVIHTSALLLTLYFYPEPLAVLFVYFAIQAATALYCYRKVLFRAANKQEVDSEMTKLGGHLSFLSILGVVSDKLDSILIFQHIGAAELALYTFAELIPDTINRFAKNLGVLAFPKFAVRANAQGIVMKTFLIPLLLLPVAIAYILVAPFLFSTFFPAYIDAVPMTQVLIFIILFSVGLPSTYIDAQGSIKVRYVINIAAGVVKIISMAVGVFFFGVWGAIIARFVGKIFSVGITFAALRWVR